MNAATLTLVSLLLAAAPLVPGETLPTARGEFLTGHTGELPAAARGHVTLVLFGFSYASRKPVEAWAERIHATWAADTSITCFEVPVMSGMAWLGRPFITGGMRKGTPPAMHERVVLLWGVSGDWKHRLDVHDRNTAYVVLLDREGRVRWRTAGALDEARWRAAVAAVDATR